MSESNSSNSSESDIKMPGYTESVLPIGLGKMGAEAGATVGAVAGPVGVVAGAAVGTVAGVAVGMAAWRPTKYWVPRIVSNGAWHFTCEL